MSIIFDDVLKGKVSSLEDIEECVLSLKQKNILNTPFITKEGRINAFPPLHLTLLSPSDEDLVWAIGEGYLRGKIIEYIVKILLKNGANPNILSDPLKTNNSSYSLTELLVFRQNDFAELPDIVDLLREYGLDATRAFSRTYKLDNKEVDLLKLVKEKFRPETVKAFERLHHDVRVLKDRQSLTKVTHAASSQEKRIKKI